MKKKNRLFKNSRPRRTLKDRWHVVSDIWPSRWNMCETSGKNLRRYRAICGRKKKKKNIIKDNFGAKQCIQYYKNRDYIQKEFAG